MTASRGTPTTWAPTRTRRGALAALRSGPCSGRRYDEVVAVTDGLPAGTDIPVAAIRHCLEQAFDYLGIPAGAITTDTEYVNN